MALRNTLRRKQRLAFTVATLGLASAIAISVLACSPPPARHGMTCALSSDMTCSSSSAARWMPQSMLDVVRQIREVLTAEAWTIAPAYSTLDQSSEPLALWAGPADSVMLHPRCGRTLAAARR